MIARQDHLFTGTLSADKKLFFSRLEVLVLRAPGHRDSENILDRGIYHYNRQTLVGLFYTERGPAVVPVNYILVLRDHERHSHLLEETLFCNHILDTLAADLTLRRSQISRPSCRSVARNVIGLLNKLPKDANIRGSEKLGHVLARDSQIALANRPLAHTQILFTSASGLRSLARKFTHPLLIFLSSCPGLFGVFLREVLRHLSCSAHLYTGVSILMGGHHR